MHPLHAAKLIPKCLSPYGYCYSKKVDSSEGNLAHRNVTLSETEKDLLIRQFWEEKMSSELTHEDYCGMTDRFVRVQQQQQDFGYFILFLIALGFLYISGKSEETNDNEKDPKINKE